jgi:hypothetical protein
MGNRGARLHPVSPGFDRAGMVRVAPPAIKRRLAPLATELNYW